MADVFISFSSHDETAARYVRDHLATNGLSVFLAPVSIEPGGNWSNEVLSALRTSNWVVFLASRVACQSTWVQQELGAAVGMQKRLVPIVWDMPPAELPGWIGRYQAVNLAGASIEQLRSQLTAIAERVKADRTVGFLILGALFAAVLIGASG